MGDEIKGAHFPATDKWVAQTAEIASLRAEVAGRKERDEAVLANLAAANAEIERLNAVVLEEVSAKTRARAERDEARLEIDTLNIEADHLAACADRMERERDAARAALDEATNATHEANDLRAVAEAENKRLTTALRCIAEMPMPEQDNMISASMRRTALDALCASPATGAAPQWCSIHQHSKWCQHNGGVLGPTGYEAPRSPAEAAAPRCSGDPSVACVPSACETGPEDCPTHPLHAAPLPATGGRCGKCRGAGYWEPMSDLGRRVICPACHGTGRAPSAEPRPGAKNPQKP